ncbi:hypothetical protein [Aliarcobacter butzleri]|uniref:hypothetical protein n=1 Tax=Aliarcobacter butzleri TaxID=28197 RepID=UPI001EDB5CAB|nr:hypothetical protein [Aliarcobacter butzleri]MCG3657940.1 hypothetical protein [Aliarcobacter butzleri]
MNSIIGSIIALISVYLGFILNSKNEEKRHKREELKLKREKLEQLYFYYLKWEDNFSSIYLQHAFFYNGSISHKELVERSKEYDKDVPDMYKKFQITMNLYFPELQTEYNKVDKGRANVVKFFDKKETYTLNEFISAQESFEKISKDFIQAIIKETKRII